MNDKLDVLIKFFKNKTVLSLKIEEVVEILNILNDMKAPTSEVTGTPMADDKSKKKTK